MKEFIINYNNMPLSEFTTIIVKANSVKEAINKFHNEKINSKEMLYDFSDCLDFALEEDYFSFLSKNEGAEYDWYTAMKVYLESNNGFKNKNKFKNLNLDKFIEECWNNIMFNRNIDPNSISLESKEAIYRYLYECVEALNIKN
ncbi:hypothetical protein WHY64_15900 (plasmid) [Clostridium perfringens]|uniref:hypothetical protein n=1 Tax=Clostridium perfringens TaxID=1502 RepID=UPI0030D266FD